MNANSTRAVVYFSEIRATARSFWFIFYHPIAATSFWNIFVAPKSIDGIQKYLDGRLHG